MHLKITRSNILFIESKITFNIFNRLTNIMYKFIENYKIDDLVTSSANRISALVSLRKPTVAQPMGPARIVYFFKTCRVFLK